MTETENRTRKAAAIARVVMDARIVTPSRISVLDYPGVREAALAATQRWDSASEETWDLVKIIVKEFVR